MKKIIILGIICLFVGMGFQPQFSIALPSSLKKLSSISNWQNCNRTLITEYGNQRIIEVNRAGDIIWEFRTSGSSLLMDAERLDNGNTLISDYGVGRVIEINSAGDIEWQKSDLNRPMDAERLQNGNTLIVQAITGDRVTNFNGSVIEVDGEGNEVWIKANLSSPIDAERLENGNTLIVEYLGGRIIEVDNSGNIVWELDGLDGPMDVEKLDTGFLITEYLGGRVFGGGWEITGLDGPVDAEPLDNGNILIVELEGDRIIEVNSSGDIVWELTGFLAHDAERLNNHPPEAPTIDGPTEGGVGQTLIYTFNAVDPDGDNVRFHIDWCDGNEEWTCYVASGTDKAVTHTWNSPGYVTIEAYAEDEHGEIGPTGWFIVIIPRNKAITSNMLLLRILERFPLLWRVVSRLNVR